VVPNSVLFFLPAILLVILAGAAVGLLAGAAMRRVRPAARRTPASNAAVGAVVFLLSLSALAFVRGPETQKVITTESSVTSVPAANYWPWLIAIATTVAAVVIFDVTSRKSSEG
jgi:hypothetical protein